LSFTVALGRRGQWAVTRVLGRHWHTFGWRRVMHCALAAATTTTMSLSLSSTAFTAPGGAHHQREMVVVGTYWSPWPFLASPSSSSSLLFPFSSLPFLFSPLSLLSPFSSLPFLLLLPYPRGFHEPVIQQALVVAQGDNCGCQLRQW